MPAVAPADVCAEPASSASGAGSTGASARLDALLADLKMSQDGSAPGRRVASWQKSDQALPGARRWHRIPLRMPLELTPVDETTGEPCGPPMIVQGRDISCSGIAFTHSRPLPWSRVAIAMLRDDGRRDTLHVRLVWCRFTRAGVYQSGGRILRATSSR